MCLYTAACYPRYVRGSITPLSQYLCFACHLLQEPQMGPRKGTEGATKPLHPTARYDFAGFRCARIP